MDLDDTNALTTVVAYDRRRTPRASIGGALPRSLSD